MIDRDNHCNVQHRKAVQQFLLIQREASYSCFCRIHITPTGPWFCAPDDWALLGLICLMILPLAWAAAMSNLVTIT